MYWIPLVLLAIVLFIYQMFRSHNWLGVIIPVAVVALMTSAIIAIDISSQTADVEVWSGYIEDWEHKEEWDQYYPPVTSCTTDANGRQSCSTTPGYWVHHPAKNKLKTTDRGWFSVSKTPDGEKMDDDFPNKTEELQEMFPKGTATASPHRYVNKVNASYSIYKHEDINLEDYPNLPSYPKQVRDELYIDRIVGDVPNKEAANAKLSQINSDLNVMIPDPENPEKKRSYKQVNIIFAQLGDNVSIDHGYALQDYWTGGNKNDFVIAFSLNDNGDVNWAYPFSWSEAELLKIEVKQVMEKQKDITDFTPLVEEVGLLIEEKFVRKEFADFNYLQIEPSKGAHIMIWVVSFLAIIASIVIDLKEISYPRNTYRFRH